MVKGIVCSKFKVCIVFQRFSGVFTEMCTNFIENITGNKEVRAQGKQFCRLTDTFMSSAASRLNIYHIVKFYVIFFQKKKVKKFFFYL